jgi:dTDP-4-dehydrorhamnose reductase
MASPKRIAVLGSSGQLGSDVVEALSRSPSYQITSFSHEQLDITDRAKVMQVLTHGFDVVVNCAAFTRVDDCEEQPAQALLVNAQGAFEVARACKQIGALCVFISTDYVFDGEKSEPYVESDPVDPVNVYGTSKLTGEFFVKQTAERWLILRIASVFGKTGSRAKGGNFIETILSKARSGGPVRVVSDIAMSPSYTVDAATAVEELIRSGALGLYHSSNAGHCTWYEFACAAVRLAGLGADIEPVSSNLYPTKARRPRNSALDTSLLEKTLGHPVRPWLEALRAYLFAKGHAGHSSK